MTFWRYKLESIGALLLHYQQKAPLQFGDREGLCCGVNGMFNQKLRKSMKRTEFLKDFVSTTTGLLLVACKKDLLNEFVGSENLDKITIQ